MKKFFISISTLLIIVVLFSACNQPAVRSSTEPEREIPNSCLPKSLDQPLAIDEQGSIDALLAKRISENYASDPYKGYVYSELSASLGNETARGSRILDSRSVWFDLRKLKSLISSIENSVCDNNCKTPLKLGVRIYFGKYPTVGSNSSEEDLRSLPASYGNKHTVFFVATYDGVNGKHIDFDPMNVGSDRCTPTPFKQLLADQNRVFRVNSLSLRSLAFSDSTVENHGGMCPPPAGSSCTFPSDF
jgi:hypothetical protein